MRVYTAPEHIVKDYPTVFLAGGITNCLDWQKQVTDYFKHKVYNYVFCNPRRDNFDINDGNIKEQIEWEFFYLERCDIFTIYFDSTDKSDQPICFYELGRNICRMRERFSHSWDRRIIITCNKEFNRLKDVKIQVGLATDGKVEVGVGDVNTHIKAIERLLRGY